MVKKILVLFLGIVAVSQAEMTPYISFSGGFNLLDNDDSDYKVGAAKYSSNFDFDEGYIVEGALGVRFTSFLRTELAVSYQDNDFDNSYKIPSQPHEIPGLPSGLSNTKHSSGSISVTAYMLNGYVDFQNKTKFTPYILVGIGYAQSRADSFGVLEEDSQCAYQVGAGVGIALSDAIVLDFKYKFFSTFDQFQFANEQEPDYINNQVQAGIRYNF